MRRPLGWALILTLPGCGGAAQAQEADRQVLHAQQAKTQALGDQLRAVQQQVRALQARLSKAEQRLGLRPFEPSSLQPAEGRLTLGKASFVARAGAKPKRRSLAKQLGKRRAAVLAFWATWCKPCIADEELRWLGRLAGQLRRQQVDLISVAVDDLSAVQRHPKSARWHYPLWHQDDAHLEMLPKAFIDRVGVSLPLFLIVTPKGALRYYRTGPLSAEVVQEIITATASLR